MKGFEARLEEINRLAEEIERRRLDLMEAGARDAGFPVKVTSTEVDLAVQYLKTLQEEMECVCKGHPFGTIAAIFPYDASVIVLARTGGGCMLTGNRFRFSFSSWNPESARLVAEISRPFDCFEPVVGQDNRIFGQNCVDDESVRLLFISGSSAVGQAYRRHHQAFDKLFFAGPGGMPAALVFPDADPEAASRFIARRAFMNGGQYCTTLKKALIHSSIYDSVRSKILKHVEKLKVGSPLDSDTDIGPILVERTRLIVENALAQCKDSRLLTGGIDGEWIYPLVLEMQDIPDLELFGPFLALKSFDNPEQAVQEITETRYGFYLAYFGTPPEGASTLFDSNFGMVDANPDFFFRPLRLPFGGKKESGWILERTRDRWVNRDGAFVYSKELVRYE